MDDENYKEMLESAIEAGSVEIFEKLAGKREMCREDLQKMLFKAIRSDFE